MKNQIPHLMLLSIRQQQQDNATFVSPQVTEWPFEANYHWPNQDQFPLRDTLNKSQK